VAFNLDKLRLKALFKFRSGVQGAPVTHHRVSNPYHAISIVVPAGASVRDGTVCPAAAACAGQRFLATGAPRLPFPGCTVARCDCRYQHYEDRRQALRRSEDSGIPAPIPWHQKERRARQGRRITD
jgi:hypothetical protein